MEEKVLEQKTVKKGIPGSTLKWIAIIAMFIDHFAAVFLDGYINTSIENSDLKIEEWISQNAGLYFSCMGLRLIGRFGFPIFAFLLVEGFTHTKHMKKYARNLFIFALISELPFNLGFSSKLFYPGYQNVFFTLLIGLLVLISMQYLTEERIWSEKLTPLFYLGAAMAGGLAMYLVVLKGVLQVLFVIFEGSISGNVVMLIGIVTGLIVIPIIGRKWENKEKINFFFNILPIVAGVALAEFLKTDYSGWGVFTIVVIYLFRKRKTLSMTMGCLALTVMSPIEITAFLMVLPVKLYNGERGMKLKYFFYAFYPVHILLLYMFTYLAGYTGFAIR